MFEMKYSYESIQPTVENGGIDTSKKVSDDAFILGLSKKDTIF